VRLAAGLWARNRLSAREPSLQPALAVGQMNEIGRARLLGVASSESDVDVTMALFCDLDGIVLGDRPPQAGTRHPARQVLDQQMCIRDSPRKERAEPLTLRPR